MLVPVQLSRAGRRCSWIDWPPEYSSAIAVKTLSVPSVTMNGGRLIRVTRKPLSRPAPSPRSTPMTSAGTAGTPFSAAIVAISMVDRIVIAPTDRSMPAVRMMSVCPIPRAAMTAVCCTSSDSEFGRAKFGFRAVNTISVRTRIRAGLNAGCRLVGDQRHAGVEELQARRRGGRRTVLGVLRDGLDAELGHLQRVLL